MGVAGLIASAQLVVHIGAMPKCDELYLLRLDESGKARGARFVKLTDAICSAAIDMNCRVLILQPKSVSALAMQLPVGRLSGRKLVMHRIRRGLHDEILRAAATAAKKENARMKAGRAKESVLIKKLIVEADAALQELRNIRQASDI